MKNAQMKSAGRSLILAAMLFNAAIAASGQPREFPRSPLVPIFTNNPVALLVISNLLTAPQPPLSVPVVSHTNASIGGTYWTLTSPAPLPMNPFPDLDVYQVSTNGVFIIDDRSVDYAELEAENASNNPIMYQPMGLMIDTNSLYLEVPTNSLATPNEFAVILHNSIQGQSYDFLTKAVLTYTNWMLELTTTGAVGNATEVWLPQSGRTNLFVWARESTGGTSFYINMPPLNQTVEDGDSVTFSVATGGNPDLTYQWTYNGVAIDGATNSSYTINNVQDSDAGQYAVTISDGTNQETTPAAQLTTDSSSPFGFVQTGNYNLIPILSQRQNYTFKSGNTYYLDSATSFYGQTTVAGGAVIKPDWYSGGSVQIMGTLDVEAEPYYPAILTSVDDDSVGEVLGFTSQDGPPFPANNGLAFLDLTYAQGNAVVNNVQIKFADIGVTTPRAAQSLDVWDSQFYECDYAIANLVNGGTNNLHNVLFADCNDAVRATTNAITINGEQITANVTRFCQSTTTPTRIALTNSLYFGTTLSASSLSTVNVVRNPNGTNFVSEGYGGYYLAANSPLHHAGSAGISPRLQSELQHKTTYAPAPIAVNTTVTGDMTLSPQAQRYTNGAPDLGYYYDALDYSVANFTLDGGSLTVLPDTAIAVRNDYNSTNGTYAVEGFFVRQGSSIISHGTPTKPNIFTAERLVQETPETGFATYKNNNGWWFGGITFVTDSEPDDLNSPAAVYDFRFSKFYLPSSDYHFWSGYDEYGDYALEVSPDSSMNLGLQDCQFHGGRINLGNPDQSSYSPTQVYPAGALTWINNSFENTAISLDPTYYRANGIVNCDMQLLAYNNLFKGGNWMLLEPFPASAGNWTFRDNLFDKVNFLQDASQPLDFDHNGYWPLLPHEFPYGGSTGELAASSGGTAGGGEVTLSNAPPYQTGAFGKFYLPVSTPLFGAGSRNPADAGLFQYTTRLDQTKEGDETGGHMVNIGLHYVAASGNAPKDTDGDGIPDFVEDANGNGSADGNETSPSNPMSDGSTPDAQNSAYDNIDLDGDGLTGAAERFFGTNPTNSDNPLNLLAVSQQSTFSGLAQIPLNISTNVDTNTTFVLKVNGVAQNTFVYQTNSNWFAVWDTTAFANGSYQLSMEYDLDDAVIGATKFVNAQNDICFPDSLPICGDSLYVQPQTVYPNGTYSMDVYDDQTNLITSLSGDIDGDGYCDDPNTGTPGISVSLLDTNGVHLASESYTVNITTSGATEQSDVRFRANDAGGGSSATKKFFYSHPWTSRRWVIAYMPVYGEIDNGENSYGYLNEMMAASVASVVGSAYGTQDDAVVNNQNTTAGDFPGLILDSSSRWNQLRGLLVDSRSRNFFYFGHGWSDLIGKRSGDHVGVGELQTTLTNFPIMSVFGYLNNSARFEHPYRFVFLDGCKTGQGPLATAFGIPNYQISDDDWNNKYHLQPRAFLGWTGFDNWTVGEAGSAAKPMPADHKRFVENFWEDWPQHLTVRQALDAATADNNSNGQFTHLNEKITLYGDPDLPFYQ